MSIRDRFRAFVTGFASLFDLSGMHTYHRMQQQIPDGEIARSAVARVNATRNALKEDKQ